MDKKVKIGVIGCGNISRIYLEQSRTFDILEVAAVADLDIERARVKAQEQNVDVRLHGRPDAGRPGH
jgi:predicted dehydrogenase